ncbi:type II toxin-antitoxin system VapC family toxin [Candidatus Woesearchaeota archaeon]|nr:type II toxin-antitoxin system VapC family toxin [Candidatus Woesearchaeota archaeon]
MAKKLLIDTDVFVDYLMGDLHAREFFEQLPEGIFYYSALTKLELLSASVCADAPVRNSTTALLSLGRRIEIDDAIISLAAEEKRKHSLPLPDSIMAATALHLKAELVTRNIGEFKKIKELLLMKPY